MKDYAGDAGAGDGEGSGGEGGALGEGEAREASDWVPSMMLANFPSDGQTKTVGY